MSTMNKLLQELEDWVWAGQTSGGAGRLSEGWKTSVGPGRLGFSVWVEIGKFSHKPD